MTSDDEMEAAQVVANWLRELADRYPCGVPLEKFLGSLDVGVLAGHCDYLLDSDDVGSVAYLIDPTCEIVRPATPDKFGVCSACGALVNMRDAVANATNYLKPLYCPNCGARVVSGDE